MQSTLLYTAALRDYTYDELLDRVFGILRERNPELTGERRRTVLKPPQVWKMWAGLRSQDGSACIPVP
jgi:translation initiation factor 2 subunit 2